MKLKASREPRWSRSLGLSPMGWWQGKRVPIPWALSYPTFGNPPLCMRNISDLILALSGIIRAQIRGRSPNLGRASSLEAVWEIPFDTQLHSELSEAELQDLT